MLEMVVTYPGWFHDGIVALQATGLLRFVEISDDDLAEQWERFGGADVIATFEKMLLHRRSYSNAESVKIYYSPEEKKLNESQVMLDILCRLSGEIYSAKELWQGSSVILELASEHGVFKAPLSPIRDDNYLIAPRDQYLSAFNGATRTGQFYVLKNAVLFLSQEQYVAVKDVSLAPQTIEKRSAIRTSLENGVPKKPKNLFLRLEDEAGGAAPHIPQFEQYKRTAYLIEGGEAVERILKFGGQNWLAQGEKVPHCRECGCSMGLYFQAPLGSLPLGIKREGVLQVFLCRGRDRWVCFDINAGVKIRIETRALQPAKGDSGWPLWSGFDLTPVDDYPDSYDWAGDGINEDLFDEDEMPWIGRELEENVKIGGWPYEGNMHCSGCKKPMVHVLMDQLFSDENFPTVSQTLGVFVCAAGCISGCYACTLRQ